MLELHYPMIQFLMKGINTRYILKEEGEWLLVIIKQKDDKVHMCAVSK